MAMALHPTVSSYSQNGPAAPQPSRSCATKVFVGLRPQSASPFGSKLPNHSAQSRRNSKPTRARIAMMPVGVPRVPYRTPGDGTWQWVDLWNALYRERVIFLGQDINEELSNQILATMLYLDSVESSKPLYLWINCRGGDITPSMSVYDTMRSLKSPVGTRCMGHAFNLAAFILAAGDKVYKSNPVHRGVDELDSSQKGNRAAMPLSSIVLQSPAGAARGKADDIQNEANELMRIRDYLFEELAKQTGRPLEKIYEDLSRTVRLSSEEAVEYGLIDRIMRPEHIKPDYPKSDEGTGLG